MLFWHTRYGRVGTRTRTYRIHWLPTTAFRHAHPTAVARFELCSQFVVATTVKVCWSWTQCFMLYLFNFFKLPRFTCVSRIIIGHSSSWSTQYQGKVREYLRKIPTPHTQTRSPCRSAASLAAGVWFWLVAVPHFSDIQSHSATKG